MNKTICKGLIDELIDNRTDNITEEAVILNNNIPFFEKEDFEIIEGEPIYFEPDSYGRSNGAIALISKNTLPLVTKKKLKYPEPNGWNENLEGKDLFERCHIIAYSLSAKISDKNNIFIGTEYLNTSIMKKVENEILHYLSKNDVKILYRVTMKYKEDDQIPTGILIEAQAINDNFSICKFCYNIQKQVKFKYSDGTIVYDKRLLPKIKQSVRKKIGTKKKKTIREERKNYIINIKTNEFHVLDNDCKKIENVELKYIQETTASEKAMLNVGLKPCKKCK